MIVTHNRGSNSVIGEESLDLAVCLIPYQTPS
uniref:Uncharacterized protein n=1 Tax=Rhizophora mucronata TaxID=61149 RepID=A0A2P2PTR3_RHIMU